MVPIPSPTFADGDKASSVTKDFTLPLTYAGEDGEETISWSSSNQDVITINGSRAEVKDVPADTEVTLTATTSKTKKTKTVKATVKSDLEIEFDREYAKPGQLMKASVKMHRQIPSLLMYGRKIRVLYQTVTVIHRQVRISIPLSQCVRA